MDSLFLDRVLGKCTRKGRNTCVGFGAAKRVLGAGVVFSLHLLLLLNFVEVNWFIKPYLLFSST